MCVYTGACACTLVDIPKPNIGQATGFGYCWQNSTPFYWSRPTRSVVNGQVKGTHEAGGVVVPHGLGVAEGLQGRVGLDDLVLQGAL